MDAIPEEHVKVICAAVKALTGETDALWDVHGSHFYLPNPFNSDEGLLVAEIDQLTSDRHCKGGQRSYTVNVLDDNDLPQSVMMITLREPGK